MPDILFDRFPIYSFLSYRHSCLNIAFIYIIALISNPSFKLLFNWLTYIASRSSTHAIYSILFFLYIDGSFIAWNCFSQELFYFFHKFPVFHIILSRNSSRWSLNTWYFIQVYWGILWSFACKYALKSNVYPCYLAIQKQ